MAEIACWSERRTRGRKVAGSNPGRSGGRIFFSRVNFVCWLLFGDPFQPRVTAVARKRPRSFCQMSRCEVTPKHAYILDPTKLEWLTVPLSRHSEVTYQETSSYATRQGTLGHSRLCWLSHCGPWTDPGVKSGISVRKLLSTLKKLQKKHASGK